VRTCEYKNKECRYNYNIDKCTKYQDCESDEIELERLRIENEKLKEQLKASHFSNVIGRLKSLQGYINAGDYDTIMVESDDDPDWIKYEDFSKILNDL